MSNQINWSVSARWGGNAGLADGFCPVSNFFLANYHRLRSQPVFCSKTGSNLGGGREVSLTSSEAMAVVQLMSFKWDHRAPYPSIQRISKRMNLTDRSVRMILKKLEDLGFVNRVKRPGKTSKYVLDGLFQALDELYRSDVEKKEGY